MKIKVLGYGEIGKSVVDRIQQVRGKKKDTFVIQDPRVKDCEGPFTDEDFEFTLVCIPYSDKFVQILLDEINICPKLIVFSTVPIGTLINIPCCCHVPIEGKHPNLADSLKVWKFFVGIDDYKYAEEYKEFLKIYFDKKEEDVSIIDRTNITEALKLLSTLNYGVNIEFTRYVADMLGACYFLWEDYTKSYNELYKYLHGAYLVEKSKGSKAYKAMEKANFELLYGIKRYDLYPPETDIGGHCIINNAKMLSGIFSDIVTKTYKLKGD